MFAGTFGGPIVISGCPRSGTNWLGKIFDSHPDTFYLMEPDTICRGDYPYTSDEIHMSAVRRHFEQMRHIRRLKAVGSRPVFPKSYLNPASFALRRGMIYGAKAAERLHYGFRKIAIPDLGGMDRAQLVIKSVSMLGSTVSWSAALPEVRFVHLVRHPCGHVDSVLRGQTTGKLEAEIPLGFETCRVAEKYGITRRVLLEMPEHLRIAWRWAILNEKAMDELEGAILVRYEDLCAAPLEESKLLLGQLGLSWHEQCSGFLGNSTHRSGGYFETVREPLVAANAWRERFDLAEEVLAELEGTRALAFVEGEHFQRERLAMT